MVKNGSHQKTNGCGDRVRWYLRMNLPAIVSAMLILLPVLAPEGLASVAAALGSKSRPTGMDGGREAIETEYRIKAAFIFNFMKFTEWPREKEPKADANAVAPEALSMKIGILGKNPFGKSFLPIQEKTIREHPIEVIEFPGFYEFSRRYGSLKEAARVYSLEYFKPLKSCHVLCLCESEKPVLAALMELLRQTEGILTIGDFPRFIDEGGMIGFRKEDNKIRFEINLKESERQSLRISSQLLKLAVRVKKE